MVDICSCQFLGFPSIELDRRFSQRRVTAH
jgi:hypothetical protein